MFGARVRGQTQKPKRQTDREVGTQSHGAPPGACQATEVCDLSHWGVAGSVCVSSLAFVFLRPGVGLGCWFFRCRRLLSDRVPVLELRL